MYPKVPSDQNGCPIGKTHGYFSKSDTVLRPFSSTLDPMMIKSPSKSRPFLDGVDARLKNLNVSRRFTAADS